MNALTPLEKAVLLEIVKQLDSPEKESLVQQIDSVSVVSRENTGVGFYTNFDVHGGPYFPLPELTNRMVEARVEGIPEGVGFVLFVKDGRLEFLEGYSYGDVTTAVDWETAAFELIDLRKKYLS